jgi:hypothetical protein
MQFQRRRFVYKSTNEKQELLVACLLTDQEEMGILYRGHSNDVSYQVSVHPCGFRGEDSLEIKHTENKYACGGLV